MADVRPLRALRYDPARVDLASTIAPPYDVISAAEQDALYHRSPYNIVRVEYGQVRADDGLSPNRYTRAANDLKAWLTAGILTREALPAIYAYRLSFEWDSKPYERLHFFAAVRLEEWSRGVIRPHELTLAGPKADRLELLRSTRTQVSPVYCLYRNESVPRLDDTRGQEICDITVDGQRHRLSRITGSREVAPLREHFSKADFYIADGHHRYETALAYRDEMKAARTVWAGEEPENFVLMAMTDVADPGLLVLPTHRLVHRPLEPNVVLGLKRAFDVQPLSPDLDARGCERVLGEASRGAASCFVAVGLERGAAHLLTLRDRATVLSAMPGSQSEAWRDLDVNVLQYGILKPFFSIDDATLTKGGAVSYTQSAHDVVTTVRAGGATCGFLLAPTAVDEIIAVSDGGERMPQKSTYFYPKLPTGLVLNAMD